MAFHEAMNRIRQSDTAPLYIGGLEVSRPETAEAFFQQQTDAIFLFDASGTIIYFNEQLPDMLGYSAETLYEHFAVFNPPDQVEAVTTFFTRALSGETVHYTAQGLHADQHRVTLKITNMPVEQDGQVIGVYGVARDITREKQLEEDVSSIRSQLELTEQIPELVVFHFDVNTQTIEFSPALLHFLGLSEVDATTLDQEQLFSRIHPRDFDPLRFEMERLIAGEKERFEMEVSLLTADETYQLLRLKPFTVRIIQIICRSSSMTYRKSTRRGVNSSRNGHRHVKSTKPSMPRSHKSTCSRDESCFTHKGSCTSLKNCRRI